MFCLCFISWARSSMARRPGPIPGRPPAWNGRRPRRPPHTTSRRRPWWYADRTAMTWRKRKMSPELTVLTPEERDELETTVLVRHKLEPQFRDLEQQHETAVLGMWV